MDNDLETIKRHGLFSFPGYLLRLPCFPTIKLLHALQLSSFNSIALVALVCDFGAEVRFGASAQPLTFVVALPNYSIKRDNVDDGCVPRLNNS
jgi:hypothetical protein